MTFNRTTITARIRQAGVRYLEAMAYADPSGFAYCPPVPITAYLAPLTTDTENSTAHTTPAPALKLAA
jgi:hypothetical protein